MRKYYLSIVIVLFFLFTSCTNNACSGIGPSISQFGITWTFDKEYEYGQFANGDYYVIDPGSGVKIINISPGSSTASGLDINGSELNPVAGITKQGYDERTASYDSSLNVGIGVSPCSPIILNATDCIVTSISNVPPAKHDYGGQTTVMNTCAVLTCMSSPPQEGTFRPSYCDRSHAQLYNINDLNRSLLQRLPFVVPNTPDISYVEGYFERVWLDNFSGWSAVYHHPLHRPNYGREIALELGEGALMLHTDLPVSQKETLLIRYVQIGIDFYGVLINGGQSNWYGEAGHGQGRKWPIIFAGLMLNDSGMSGIGTDGGNYNFGMDDETFYVSQNDVDITNGPSWNPDTRSGTPHPYTSDMIGMPEWGIRHSSHPEQSDASWYAIYRQCCCAIAWQGEILACLIMGAKDLWNHDALFDYMDRYMAITNGDPDPFGYIVPGEAAGWRSSSRWLENMWDAYIDEMRY